MWACILAWQIANLGVDKKYEKIITELTMYNVGKDLSMSRSASDYYDLS
jgi:hypothetical protein